MRRALHLVLGLIASASVVTAVEGRAEACSQQCEDRPLPFADKTMPGPIAFLPIQFAQGSSSSPLSLLLDGVEVDAAIKTLPSGEKILEPAEPLGIGEYTLRHAGDCTGTSTAARFRVTETTPLPKAPGRLVVTKTFYAKTPGPQPLQSTCGGGQTFAFDQWNVSVEYEPDPSLADRLPLMRVDSKAEGPRGVSGSPGITGQIAQNGGKLGLFGATVACEPGHEQASMPAGTYRFQATAIVNGEELPAVSETLDIACPAPGTEGRPDVATGSDGCVMSTKKVASSGPLGFALVGASALVIVLRRRRRGRGYLA